METQPTQTNFALNANSTRPGLIVRPAFDPYHPETAEANQKQTERAVGWFPHFGVGVVVR